MEKEKIILTRFGERVRSLRKERGISQEKFAELCGLDRTYISGIERGTRNVSLINIETISHALGISKSDLFKGI